MFAWEACSCSRLIHPMSVFRRIIRDARLSPAQCKSLFTQRLIVGNARGVSTVVLVRGSGSENSRFKPSNVRPEGLLVLEADPPDVGFPTNHQRDARSSPAQCKSPVYTATDRRKCSGSVNSGARSRLRQCKQSLRAEQCSPGRLARARG
ncbi:hypothetical protein GE061_010258 [Apolygus lucorum]|uniref:Uncharacterized protein n=1 Tax=Apolygus lucorum TaxID=248454 RepID=A0A8S9Y3U0_APOLU|nr:hypothetical protein GE061_010258 [Apolygus lucorum]